MQENPGAQGPYGDRPDQPRPPYGDRPDQPRPPHGDRPEHPQGGPQQPHGDQPAYPPAGPQYPYGGPAPWPHGPYAPPPARPSWYLPTPGGARYDHLARTTASQPWRAIAGTALVGAAFFVVSFVVLTVGVVVAAILGIPAPLEADRLFGDPVFGLVVLLLSIAAVLPIVFGTAALVQRRRPGTLSSVEGRLRWGWLACCLGVAVVALVLGQAAQVLTFMATGGEYGDVFGWAGWQAFLPALVVIVLLVPFQAATEEYLFRGWLIQAAGVHLRDPVWAVVGGAVLFTLLHGYTGAGSVDVFVFGVVVGWLTVRTGGLEAAIGLHVVNNVVAFGLSAAAGQLEKSLQQGAVPWQALAGTVVQLGVYTFGVLYLAKKRSIRAVSQ